MPVMNGYDATRAIRAGSAGVTYQSIPIIAMTANAMKGESEKCMAAGMNDYITKPVEPSLLIRKISQHIPTGTETQDESEPVKVDTSENEFVTAPLWKKDDALIRLGGREPLLAQLLALFVKGAEQKFEAIQDAFTAQDREKLRFSAHALKGNSGDVGAEALHKTLAELEQQAPDAPFDTLKLLVESSQTLLNETLQIFYDYLQSQA